MVFWLNDSDLAIQAVCWAGPVVADAGSQSPAASQPCSASIALYLSLFYAGQTFMNFQWDTFLLETAVRRAS